MLIAKLEEKDIHLIPSEELIAHSLSRAFGGISTQGFDPQILSRLSRIGARPIKRMIQKELLNELSSADHRRDVGNGKADGDGRACLPEAGSTGGSCCASRSMKRRRM